MASTLNAHIIGKRYILGQALGSGGMGAVYRANDRLTGTVVALKRVLPPHEQGAESSGNSQDHRLALAQEFRLMASLRHPNIISVIDYGFDDDQQPYYTMELLENAHTILEAGAALTLPEKINLIIQVLQALAYLHRRGVIHRDLKPRNVLVVEGQVKVLDFGLSTASEYGNESGSTSGTLAYMAPEVLTDGQASEAADLYATGVIAYELIGGNHPFDSQEISALLHHILYTYPDISKLNIDGRLAVIIERLLAKNPETRYRSASQVIKEIIQAVSLPMPEETAATRESFIQAARMIGRDDELKKLTHALNQAITGEGSAWLIGGESGVGKSRLLDEVRSLAMVRGALVMRGQGVSEATSPYSLWRPALRWQCLMSDLDNSDLAILKTLLPDIGSLLEREIPNPPESDPKTVQSRLLTVITKMFQQQKHPLMLILEDLHWANESLDVLIHLLPFVQKLPLLVIGSYRDDEQPNLPRRLPGMNLLKLERLTEAGIARLSEAMLGESGKQPHVVELLQRETEGNVFFLVEVVRALAEEAGQLERIGMVTLPASVFAGGIQQIIERRLRQLPDYTFPLLQLAAVMGRWLDLDALRCADAQLDLPRWLATCADASILEVQEGDWRFVHDRLRDGILRVLSPDQRKILHERVGSAVEKAHPNDSAYYSILFYHYGNAGIPVKEAYYAALAGEQALHNGVYRDALGFLERALVLLSESSDLERKKNKIDLRQHIAEAHLGLGQYEAAKKLYHENLTDAQEIAYPKTRANVLLSLGDVAAALANYAEATSQYQESLKLYRELDDQPAIGRVLSRLGSVAYESGALEQARMFFQESLQLSREAGNGWGMAGSMSHTKTDDADSLAEAKDALQTAVKDYQGSGDKAQLKASLQKFINLSRQPNEGNTILQTLRNVLEGFRQQGDKWAVAATLNYLGRAAHKMNSETEARSAFHEALKAAHETGETGLTLDILVGLADLFRKQGLKSRAIEFLALSLQNPNIQEQTENEAESLIFELDQDVTPQELAEAWERGKNLQLHDVIPQLLETLSQ